MITLFLVTHRFAECECIVAPEPLQGKGIPRHWPVFLVVQFHCCPICGCNERWGCIAWEASEFPILILFEERDVLVFELDRLFCFVVCPLYCVLTDAQEVVESN